MWSNVALSHLKNVVFPGLVELADEKSSFGEYMADAVYHEKPSVMLERLVRLESVMLDEIADIKKMMKDEG